MRILNMRDTMIMGLVFNFLLIGGCFVNGRAQTNFVRGGTVRRLPKTDKPTINPTSEPTRSPTGLPTQSHHPSFSPTTLMPSSKPSSITLAPSFSTSAPSSLIISSSMVILPLESFSLGFEFPSSTAMEDINFILLTDILQSFLSDYISFQWPTTKHENSRDISLDEYEKEVFDLYQYQQSQIDIKDFSQQTRNLQNTRRQLQPNNNQIISTAFEGQSLIQEPTKDQYKKEKLDPPSFLEEERILFALKLKLRKLQEEALSNHLTSFLDLIQTNAIGENHKVLASISNVVPLSTDVSIDVVLEDVAVDVEKDNDSIDTQTSTVDKAGTELTNSSNTNPPSSGNKMIIIMAVVTSVLGIVVLMGAVKVYRDRKEKPLRANKRREASTANNTEEHDDFTEMLDIYEIKHQVKRSANKAQKKTKKTKSYEQDYDDDLSSIGMGTAVFNPALRKNELDDEVSQVSLDYSMDGQSIETRRIPKYARSDHSIDGDDDTTFHEAKLLTASSRSVISEAKSKASRSNVAHEQLPPPSPNAMISPSSYKSNNDAESVWTFSRMGGDDQLEEGIEVASVLRPNNSYDEDDESLYGFTKFTAKDRDQYNDSYSHVHSPNLSHHTVSSDDKTPKKKTPVNKSTKKYHEESFSSIDGPMKQSTSPSEAIEKSFSSIDGAPDSWNNDNKVSLNVNVAEYIHLSHPYN